MMHLVSLHQNKFYDIWHDVKSLKCSSGYFMHEGYKGKYVGDPNFQDIYHKLSNGNENGNIDFLVHDGLLFHSGKICIPIGEMNYLIREAHTYHIL